jgi:hypothetical protein
MDLLSELRRSHEAVELEGAIADFREREAQFGRQFDMPPEPLDPTPEPEDAS